VVSRLIEEQHVGLADQAGGDVEATPHAARIGLGRAVAGLGEAEALEHLARAAARLLALEVVETPDHLEVLMPGQVLVDGGRLPGEPDAEPQGLGVLHDVEPVDLGSPGGRRQQGREDADARRLAGSVGAEQAEHRSLVHFEVDAFEGLDLAEGLHESFRADDGRGHNAPP
jgi:hypothetical protein